MLEISLDARENLFPKKKKETYKIYWWIIIGKKYFNLSYITYKKCLNLQDSYISFHQTNHHPPPPPPQHNSRGNSSITKHLRFFMIDAELLNDFKLLHPLQNTSDSLWSMLSCWTISNFLLLEIIFLIFVFNFYGRKEWICI